VPDAGAHTPPAAIIFDIDGTMYRQGPLRRAMLVRLFTGHLTRPFTLPRTLRALQAYRQAQEHLRDTPDGDVAHAQLRWASERAHIDPQSLANDVDRWMEREPLPLLARYARPGLRELLVECRARGIKLAALSDYPAQAKLDALGVGDLFDAVLCAQDKDVDAFKPNPRGLLVAMTRLGSRPVNTLYVGDREEVDAVAARAAGMRCALISDTAARSPSGDPLRITRFSELHTLVASPR